MADEQSLLPKQLAVERRAAAEGSRVRARMPALVEGHEMKVGSPSSNNEKAWDAYNQPHEDYRPQNSRVSLLVNDREKMDAIAYYGEGDEDAQPYHRHQGASNLRRQDTQYSINGRSNYL